MMSGSMLNSDMRHGFTRLRSNVKVLEESPDLAVISKETFWVPKVIKSVDLNVYCPVSRSKTASVFSSLKSQRSFIGPGCITQV